eukprot:110490-Prymnesium_polylepis.1
MRIRITRYARTSLLRASWLQTAASGRGRCPLTAAGWAVHGQRRSGRRRRRRIRYARTGLLRAPWL